MAKGISAVDRAWRPADQKRGVLVRWMMSEWCNYRCPYCPQTHDRRADKGGGFTAHCFDNFPLSQWLDAFDRHFDRYRLSLVMTGGETMIDRKNMSVLLNHLSAKETVESIRLDTNSWWRPDQFPGVDFSKVILMCTFHPTQTDEEKFKANIRLYKDAGIKIGIVNYVMDAPAVASFGERHKRFKDELGVYLHPNPLWNATGTYAEESKAVLKDYLPELDFELRSGKDPFGKTCRFPSLSYELDYKGAIFPGCLPKYGTSFFVDELPPNPIEDITCPMHYCVCLDKYSFLKDVERNVSLNPLGNYSDALFKTRARREWNEKTFLQRLSARLRTRQP